ncbi:hypothetical protein [Vulcanisaeta souniana]|uniref:hypothetical protein n=1 Tax=Vulcanisaeta souniana TaxID=164452 RepID=UPI0006CF9849|nr:hypothetical protein [Vulcanisaeta souniana]
MRFFVTNNIFVKENGDVERFYPYLYVIGKSRPPRIREVVSIEETNYSAFTWDGLGYRRVMRGSTWSGFHHRHTYRVLGIST